MSMPESLEALRRANPRGRARFGQEVEAVGTAVYAAIATGDAPVPLRSRPGRRLVGICAAGAALAVAAAVVAFFTVGSSGVESATAAFEKAATVTAASAERSGIAVVRINHDGELWAGSTISWHGTDLAVSQDAPDRAGKVGSVMLVVDGVMYGIEDGRWTDLGSTKSIDPDSGTTPDETLAAVREDIGGATLHRVTAGMTGLTARELADGSTVYSGSVAAGLIARESGFKEGEALRVFPFGYVAHDEAADPAALLDTAVTVGPDGIVRELAVTWGTWTYTVTYHNLGATGALQAPQNPARPLRGRLRGK